MTAPIDSAAAHVTRRCEPRQRVTRPALEAATEDRYGHGMDAAELSAAFAQHRHELHVHCYRMTGSFADAEELTQETFERAWRHRTRFERRASVRTWLYTIATHACLDHLRRHERRTAAVGDAIEILEHDRHVQPYTDDHLVRRGSGDPAEVIVTREATELFFVAALTGLSPRQRAVLIVTELLGWSVAEAATLVNASTAATNSLLQRARVAMRRMMVDTPSPSSDTVARELL